MKPRLTLTVEPYIPVTDSHNKAVDAWGPAREVPVYGWAPAATDQPVEGNRQPVVTTVDVYAPAGTTSHTKDRWTLPDGTYLQVGDAKDYTNGPWVTPAAGVAIRLRQIRG